MICSEGYTDSHLMQSCNITYYLNPLLVCMGNGKKLSVVATLARATIMREERKYR